MALLKQERSCKMKRLVALLVLAILSITLSMGCASKPEKIKIGYIPIADCAQLYVGIEKGFFKQEGIEIELLSLAGGAKILEALATGSLDIGFSNVVSLVLAKNSGLKFIALTGGPIEDSTHKEHAILIRKDSSIKTPKDLEGKTIALNTRRNIDDLFVREYLEKNNVNADKTKFVEMPFPNMENALLSGDVDAVASIEPFVTFALLHGESKILDYNYVVIEPKIEISTYVVSEDWLEKNKEMGDRFVKAFNKATDYALTHESEVRTIITKYTKLDQAQAQQIALPTFGKKLTVSELQKMVDKLFKRGWIDKTMDASLLVYMK